MFMFENLQVYQKSVDLAEKITSITHDFPKGYFYLTDQLNRAILSVTLNITEGNGRWHKNDRKHFFYISRGSTQECVPILELCRRKKLISDEVNME
jgi:four helix bundle protein